MPMQEHLRTLYSLTISIHVIVLGKYYINVISGDSFSQINSHLEMQVCLFNYSFVRIIPIAF